MYVFTKLFAAAGCHTTSIFMQSLIGANSEFSFSKSSCHMKAKEPSLLYYLFYVKKEKS